MAQQVLTLTEIQDIFYDVTQALLNYPIGKVIHSYNKNGQPSIDRDDNAVFINVIPITAEWDKLQDITYEANLDNEWLCEETVKYTRIVQASWIFYGDASFDDADLLRSGLFRESARSAFRSAGIFIIPSIDAPTRAPESKNGQWFERVDVRANFYVATQRQDTINFIQSAEIEIHADTGLERFISIQEP